MYNLDPNRETPYKVVDYTDEVGREGIYAGSWEDCQEFLTEQASVCSCLGLDIVPNPYYKTGSR
jgi:hypothetical protein